MSSVSLVFQPFVFNYLDAAALHLALGFLSFTHFTLPRFISRNAFFFASFFISTNCTFLEPKV